MTEKGTLGQFIGVKKSNDALNNQVEPGIMTSSGGKQKQKAMEKLFFHSQQSLYGQAQQKSLHATA